MRRIALGVALASLALVTACGGDAEETVESATAEASESATSATDGASESAGSATESAAGGASTVLIGTVGTPEDPEAFEIALTTEDGQEVETLPAGNYTIQVSDPAATHNFHLRGGSVDETTSVPEVEETTFEVTLEPGEYTYVCDPHPPMTGSFTVT
ncbi:MAG TPA: hypothetical protein VFR07_06660 [Mycobacteriales bacterium]|jgi:plastocyanin|nr:hypothetical protein [Mycobacteriales bacterium]